MGKIPEQLSDADLAAQMLAALRYMPDDSPSKRVMVEAQARLVKKPVEQNPVELSNNYRLADWWTNRLGEYKANMLPENYEVVEQTIQALRSGDIPRSNAYMCLAVQEVASALRDLGTVMTQTDKQREGNPALGGIAIGFDRAAASVRRAAGLDPALQRATIAVVKEEENTWKPTHRHIARGTTYRVLGQGKFQTALLDSLLLNDDSPLVVYQGEDGQLWARNPGEFADGRFEALTNTEAKQLGETGDAV